ncbi:MAG: hypothetical protein HW388_1551 [Dehalococcoidia bacterium]|nr:hypothetical protein [Dehalococcoidia bacterium]
MEAKRAGGPGRLLAGRSGFTLVEVLVAVSILTMAVGMVGSGIFQSLSVQRSWQGKMVATKEWRRAHSWFVGDALNSETTNLVDGAPAADTVTLAWTGSDEVLHTATYRLSESGLVREFDGVETVVARKVVSAAFSLSGKLLTLDLEVETGGEAPESASLKTYLRLLQ